MRVTNSMAYAAELRKQLDMLRTDCNAHEVRRAEVRRALDAVPIPRLSSSWTAAEIQATVIYEWLFDEPRKDFPVSRAGQMFSTMVDKAVWDISENLMYMDLPDEIPSYWDILCVCHHERKQRSNADE